MFLEFFYFLKTKGLDVSINEWMLLMEALDKGLAHSSLTSFYYLCRSILIKSESDYDKLDMCFAEFFEGIETSEILPKRFGNGLPKMNWKEISMIKKYVTVSSLSWIN